MIRMKRTQFKDAVRNILRQKVSYISIIVIAMLAVTAYLGISFSSHALSRQADRFFTRMNFRDAEVVSTLLVTEDDLSAIRATEGVRDAEGVYAANGKIERDSERQTVSVLSLTSRVNVPELKEGRLPQTTSECVLETEIAKQLGISVGDRIHVAGTKSDMPAYLLYNDFTVVGLALHPDYYGKIVVQIGSRYVLVLPEVFDREALDGCYMKVEVQYEKPDAISFFGKAYADLSTVTTEKLNALAPSRAKLRDAEVLAMVKAELDAGKAKLDGAQKTLDRVVETLGDSFTLTEERKATIRQMIRTAVASACGEAYADSLNWAESQSYDADSADNKASVFQITDRVSVDLNDSLDTVIDNAVLGLLSGTEQEARVKQVVDLLRGSEAWSKIKSEYNTVADLLKKWDNGQAQLIKARELFDQGGSKYDSLLAAFDERMAEHKTDLEENGEWRERFEKKYAQRKDFILKREKSVLTFANGAFVFRMPEQPEDLDISAYWSGLDAYEDTGISVNEGCRWVILDVNGNIGYQHAKNSAQNITNIGMTFSMLFVLVGALVIYATVGRMVEEQRRLIGTTKSLGFYNREVLLKYLLFGLSATLLGVLLGILLGYFVVQKVVLIAHQSFYADGVIPRSFQLLPTVLITVIGAALAALSVWTACASMVRAPARELMQERVPRARKASKRAGKNGRSLYARLILRNVLSDKKRVIVTIISIAGCCTLLMIGFTLRYGISEAIRRQYGEITHYEQELRFDPSVSKTAKDEIEAVLDAQGIVYSEILTQNLILSDNGEMLPSTVITGRADAIERFYVLKDPGSKAPVLPDAQGFLIYNRMSETRKLSAGDSVTVYDARMNPYPAKIAGVYNNHFGRNVFLSEEGYRAIFGKDPAYNALWIAGSSDPGALNKTLYPIPGYEGMTDLAEKRASAEKIASILTLITGILIVCAGMMAYFILLNLTGMYLAQKQRELTIMRINGFTTKEVIGYASRETFFITTIGIVLGLGLGMLLGYAILRFLEQPQAQFVRTVSWVGILLSAALTALFAVGINAIALRKVRNLKLTDVV